MFFGLQLRFEAGEVARVLRFNAFGPFFKRRIAPVELEQLPLPQPQGRGGNALQKAAVVADDEAGAALAGDDAFELFDRGDVEVVGRLVEEENVGVGGKRPRQRRAARLAAGKSLRRTLGIEAELLQRCVSCVSGRDRGAANPRDRWRLGIIA